MTSSIAAPLLPGQEPGCCLGGSGWARRLPGRRKGACRCRGLDRPCLWFSLAASGFLFSCLLGTASCCVLEKRVFGGSREGDAVSGSLPYASAVGATSPVVLEGVETNGL